MAKRWYWIVFMLLMAINVIAQDAQCEALQQAAFDAIEEFCAEQSGDVMCYGSPTVSVNYNEIASDRLRFSLPGDVIPITAVDWFSTSSEAGTWGAVRADLQAYARNSLTPVSSRMVVFGDVIIQNNGTENITLPTYDLSVTIQQGANVRVAPSTEARIMEPVMRDALLKASGRLADNTWVRIHTSRDEIGWVSTTAVSEEYMDLPIVDPDDEPDDLIMPLQAFDFQSGLPILSCENAGLSGILLQSYPEDLPPVYEINELSLELDGTAFLQAHPEMGILVAVLDGTATLTALEESQQVNEGYVSRVFTELEDEENRLIPIEIPGIPLAYDYDVLRSLPLNLLAEGTTLGLDIYTLITPRPIGGGSPIAGMALDAPCKFTVGQSGANIRSEPSPDASIIAVMGYRESATPIGRTIGTDGMPWWKLADGIWIRIDTTVTGGDCTTVPRVEFEG